MNHEVSELWRDIYGAFLEVLDHNPSILSLLELAESLSGCPMAVTDEHGTVVSSSPSYRGGAHIEPPGLIDTMEGRAWRDDCGAATPAGIPGRWFVWMLDGADPNDPVHRTALFLTAEFTFLLKSFNLAAVPVEWHDRVQLTERMLRGSDGEYLLIDARRLGYEIDRTAHVVVVESAEATPAIRIAVAIGSRIRRFGLLTTRRGQLVVVVLGQRALDELLATLTSITDVGLLRIGVSGPQPSGLDLREALEQASAAAHSPDPGLVVRFAEQDPVAVIAHLADPTAIQLFIHRALGPLLEYNRAHRAELLATLREWLDATDSLESVADRLHVHKSTLIYRVRRIKDLLGDDLVDGKRRFETALALRLLDQIGSPTDTAETTRAS